MAFIMFVSMIELLVAAIQAYVFAILTSLYIGEAVHLH
jgi:F-type H+-transporting ATPase subunit a